MTASDILGAYHVSAAATALVRGQFPNDAVFGEAFKFTGDEFSQHIAYRSVELSNGALLTAPAAGFDDVFAREEMTNGTRFSTVGNIVDDKLRKTKS